MTALAKRAPVTAVMSQQQRSRIEEVLQQLRQADVGLMQRDCASTGNEEGDHLQYHCCSDLALSWPGHLVMLQRLNQMAAGPDREICCQQQP